MKDTQRMYLVSSKRLPVYLKELGWITGLCVEERKHFTVANAFARCHPLHVALPEAPRSPQGVAVINKTRSRDCHCLETTVGMFRETRDSLSMVPLRRSTTHSLRKTMSSTMTSVMNFSHAPTIFVSKVRTHIPPP